MVQIVVEITTQIVADIVVKIVAEIVVKTVVVVVVVIMLWRVLLIAVVVALQLRLVSQLGSNCRCRGCHSAGHLQLKRIIIEAAYWQSGYSTNSGSFGQLRLDKVIWQKSFQFTCPTLRGVCRVGVAHEEIVLLMRRQVLVHQHT